MDFFQAQESARRNTVWLVLMFLVAVLCIVIAIYLIVQAMIIEGHSNGIPPESYWNGERFMWVALVTYSVIMTGSAHKIAQLSGGGSVVAKALGGRRIPRNTSDRLERRLLNVVEEMAVASGLLAPQVYLLDDEVGINAFAAGTKPENAVVAVTQGALERLTRDELQGVIGHEFSHILNGDMRLNIQMIGLLNGFLFIALIGRHLEHYNRSSSRDSMPPYLAGLGLVMVGKIGVFFGNMIKAAISRQREFLADASSVQFTRNPAGLAGALKKIAGVDTAYLGHPNAEEASHMYFGAGVARLFDLFASHPPIVERIARLDPYFVEEGMPITVEPAPQARVYGAASEAAVPLSPQQLRASVGTLRGESLDYARGLLDDLPELMIAELHDPQQASAVLFALLAAQLPEPEQVLRDKVTFSDPSGRERALRHLHWLRKADPTLRLPLVELLLPAIVELPAEEIERLWSELRRLVRDEKGLSLFGFALGTLLRNVIEGPARRKAAPRGRAAIRRDLVSLLSFLAYAGHKEPAQARAAFLDAISVVMPTRRQDISARSDLSFQALDAALTHLDRLKPRVKGRLIEACVSAIASDGCVTLNESELLRVIGVRLNCPVPPLTPGKYPDLAINQSENPAK